MNTVVTKKSIYYKYKHSKNSLKYMKSKKKQNRPLTIPKGNDIEVSILEQQIEKEFSKIFSKTVITVFLMTKNNKTQFKSHMHKLLDNPGSNKLQVDINLDLLYNTLNTLYKKTITHYHKKTNKRNNLHIVNEPNNNLQSGGVAPAGPYLQRLTTIGDQPITGNDMAKALEEIIIVLNDMQYLQEDGGPNIRGFNVLLNYFNGDTENMKYFLRYYFAPKFYSMSPPFLNFNAIGKRLDNIIDFLNIYKNDKRIKNQFNVESGIKSAGVLQDTFAEKLISKWDKLDQDYNRFNRYRRLQFF